MLEKCPTFFCCENLVDFFVEIQTLVVCQAAYSPDIRRYRQKNLNQMRFFSRSVIFLTMKIRREQ